MNITAPKISEDHERYEVLKDKIKEKRIEQNSFLDPLNTKAYIQLNAMPILGLSAASRIGKG